MNDKSKKPPLNQNRYTNAIRPNKTTKGQPDYLESIIFPIFSASSPDSLDTPLKPSGVAVQKEVCGYLVSVLTLEKKFHARQGDLSRVMQTQRTIDGINKMITGLDDVPF